MGIRSALTETSFQLAAFFLGTNPVAVKYAVSEIPPLSLAALRFTLTGLLLLGLLRLVEPRDFPERRNLLRLAGLGLIGVAANQAAFAVGVKPHDRLAHAARLCRLTALGDAVRLCAGAGAAAPAWGRRGGIGALGAGPCDG